MPLRAGVGRRAPRHTRDGVGAARPAAARRRRPPRGARGGRRIPRRPVGRCRRRGPGWRLRRAAHRRARRVPRRRAPRRRRRTGRGRCADRRRRRSPTTSRAFSPRAARRASRISRSVVGRREEPWPVSATRSSSMKKGFPSERRWMRDAASGSTSSPVMASRSAAVSAASRRARSIRWTRPGPLELGEPRQRGVPPVELVRAEGHRQHDRLRAQATDEEGQRLAGRRVGPVDVFNDDQDGLDRATAGAGDRSAPRTGGPAAIRAGPARRAEAGSSAGTRRARSGPDGPTTSARRSGSRSRATWPRISTIGPYGRPLRTDAGAGATQDEDPAILRDRRELGRETALAHARFAGDQEMRRYAVGRGRERAEARVELRATTDGDGADEAAGHGLDHRDWGLCGHRHGWRQRSVGRLDRQYLRRPAVPDGADAGHEPRDRHQASTGGTAGRRRGDRARLRQGGPRCGRGPGFPMCTACIARSLRSRR